PTSPRRPAVMGQAGRPHRRGHRAPGRGACAEGTPRPPRRRSRSGSSELSLALPPFLLQQRRGRLSEMDGGPLRELFVPLVASHLAFEGSQGDVADRAMMPLRIIPQALVQGFRKIL